MKTAREIIARYLAQYGDTGWCLVEGNREGEARLTKSRAVHTDTLIARLAAEGFSIVETGRDPVTIEMIRAILDDDDADVYEKLGDIRAALSRSTREGKTG